MGVLHNKKRILLVLFYSVIIYYSFAILKASKSYIKNELDDAVIELSNSKDSKNILFDNDNDGNVDNVANNESNIYNKNIEGENHIDNENNIDDDNTNQENIIKHIEGDNTNEEDNSSSNNDNNKSSNNSDNNNNSNNSNDPPPFKKYRTGMEYVLHYDGGEIEPEWDWVRSISIVYTWVDGSDVDFSDIKAKYNGGIRASNSRDRSADELRYSIRSVEKYMPWHNGTIYIVTSQQVPKWLDTTNPRVKMVYHKDIFPENIYPTYDSNTIEMFFDKIPGVTERFIYFNDDVFLNNYVHPCFFFTRKTFYPKIYRRMPVKLDKDEVEKIIAENDIHQIFTASKYFTRELAREYFDKKFEYRDLFHTPHVYYRDLMEPFRELFHEELKGNFSNRFRSGHKFLTQYLFQVFMEYATQHSEFPLKLGGKGKANKFVGKPLPANHTIQKYGVKVVAGEIGDYFAKFGKITDSSRRNNRYFTYIRNRPNLLVYNFNDAYTKERSLYEFTGFMIGQYPEPSSFEKQEYIELEKPYSDKIVETNNYIKEVTADLKSIYDSKRIGELKLMLRRHRLNIVKEYVGKKNELAGPIKEISDREQEEIDFLTSYQGEELSSEWEWVKNISIVYVIENINENLKDKFYIDQLKYSLRSIEKYLPWYEGKIYIISMDEDNNGLDWIKVDNERIEIIYYRDIIPKETYPTENRHVIEMYLDKIPNLSEKFIYLKPYHYFRDYIHPRFFFSKEFYPKYNYNDAIPIEKSILARHSSSSFIYTYKAIVRYFGEGYVNTFRHSINAPYPLYRDLFEPARTLFEDYVKKTVKHKDYSRMDILPIYMVQNYNIYGTSQPFYPDYVPGYGFVRKAALPKLNPERTIQYYGFDVSSPKIIENTIYSRYYKSESSNEILDELENTVVNFFVSQYQIFIQ